MEEMSQTLDEDEFIDAVGRLYDTLSVLDKNKILKLKDKWNANKSKM